MAAISSIPAGIIGALFGDLIDQTFRFDWVVVIMLVVVAIIFLLVEKFSKQATNLEQLTWKQAMIMGCVQALALIPGTSRSGITMSFGMLFGLKRVAAARFSFIMVIPLLLGLTVKKGYDLSQASLSNHDLLVMLLGASVAAVVGLFCIRFLLVYFQRYTLKPFAYYRIILAVVVSLVLFL
jgi:undecaprenyl-diphosphatase